MFPTVVFLNASSIIKILNKSGIMVGKYN